jgi:hypothetical protein
MTEQDSPWSRPEPGRDAGGTRPVLVTASAGAGPAGAGEPGLRYGSGIVTRFDTPPASDVIAGGPPDPPEDLARRNRIMLRWFGGGAAAIVLVGLVVLLAMVLTGSGGGLLHRTTSGPPDTRPQLAKLCPPPSDRAGEHAEAPPPPPGPRTVDPETGISYRAYAAPWVPWDQVWSAGTLHVRYRVGQHFITENYGAGGYHASILSGSVPATVNDALVLDLKCTGRQVAADARVSYYPQPNTIETMREELTTLGGRPAWLTKFRLHFRVEGLQATSELVGIALVDVGRPEAAVLYVSIPNTHPQYDRVVDEVLDSVRPV